MATIGFIVILIAGLRWNTGTDWGNYLYYFTQIDNRPFGNSGMEIGYEVLVRSFKTLVSSDPTPFLFFCAIFIVSTTYFTLFKYSPFPLFSLFLLISYSLVGSGFGVRQDLAIALSFLSIMFIKEREFYKFAIIMVLAALIHNSSLIFFPAYFLYNFKWTVLNTILIVVVVIVCVLMSETIMQTFGSMVSENKAETYLEMGMETTKNPYTTLAKGLSGRFLFLLIVIGFVKYGTEKDDFYNGVFNIYVFGIIIYTIFSPINLIFSRLARPYDIFQIILLPMAYYQAKRSYKVVIILILFAFSFLKFSTFVRDDEEVYIPYKTILSQ
ncbi:EpsG family protein [Dyadobacter sp. CY323]|uniref:EpsG family protein n=1 Tax=Dyadobacter sp. CY323 TaxID=2907302 RepID=UPI001F334FA2|nr:EpsG family protein [Dyadobacter sp. CY323]MCE6990962.1 EpsG family protein [Dyadobacter sp. CY323]